MIPLLFTCLYFGGAFGTECGLQCKAIRVLTADKVEISDGVRFVRTSGNETARTSPDTIVTALRDLFGRYDLQVRLNQFLPPQDEFVAGLRKALTFLSEESRANGAGKKNGLLMMATMMGGTVAALGFGALGMMAMKALTVSAMALMLSVIMGLKKLLSKNEHESGHIVSYVPVHHGVRRRRDLPALLSPTYF